MKISQHLYRESLIDHIQFLERHLEKDNVNINTLYLRDLFVEARKNNTDVQTLHAFFEAETKIIRHLLENYEQDKIINLVQAIRNVDPFDNTKIDKIQLRLLTEIIVEEAKQSNLFLYPERKAILKNVVDILQVFVTGEHNDSGVTEKWNLIQGILSEDLLENRSYNREITNYPYAYGNIIKKIEIILDKAKKTPYSSEVQKIHLSQDLFDIRAAYNNLKIIQDELKKIHENVQKSIEQKTSDNDFCLELLDRALVECQSDIAPFTKDIELEVSNLAKLHITGDTNQNITITDT